MIQVFKDNISHKLLLTNTQVSRLRKYFANNSSANIKLSKTQFHKVGKSGAFFGLFGSGTTTLMTSNNEMNDIMKIIKFLEAGLLISGSSKTIKNEAKEQIRRFLGMLSNILRTSLLGNQLAGKGTIRKG